MFLELSAHSDARVLHMELVTCLSQADSRLLNDPDADGSAGRRILYRIAQQIQHNLAEMQPVAHHILIDNARGINEEIHLFFIDIRLHNGPDLPKHFRQMYLCFLNFHAAAFNTAHIKNVIDQ